MKEEDYRTTKTKIELGLMFMMWAMWACAANYIGALFIFICGAIIWYYKTPNKERGLSLAQKKEAEGKQDEKRKVRRL
jgi:hypothetical protein